MSLLLRTHTIAKSFSGVRALSGVNFDLRRGEVHALVGENGAGKSTLIKIITGAHAPDSGTLEIDGQDVTDNNPLKSKALGVAAIYQQPALFPELTVAENIALGLERRSMFGRVDWNARRKRARELLDLIGARIDPSTTADELSIPEQQLVEIARALGTQAKILILDEPTASLSEEEVENLFRVIQDLRNRQVGMIYISHRLEELRRIGDRVTILRDGRSIATHADIRHHRSGVDSADGGTRADAGFSKTRGSDRRYSSRGKTAWFASLGHTGCEL